MVPRSWRDDTLAFDRPQGRPVGFEDAGRKNFLYHFLKAGPAGGLRPPSGPATRYDGYRAAGLARQPRLDDSLQT
jgi:hypothetical protein